MRRSTAQTSPPKIQANGWFTPLRSLALQDDVYQHTFYAH